MGDNPVEIAQKEVARIEKERKELKKEKKKIDDTERWACFVCKEDFLRLVIYQKVNEPYYFRRCSGCGNRTKGKKFDDSVEGIRPGEDIE